MSKLERIRQRMDRNSGGDGEILNRVVREFTSEEVTFEHRAEGADREIMWLSGRRAVQAERIACAKALRQGPF